METGEVLEEFPLRSRMWHSIDKDLVLSHAENEVNLINHLKNKYGVPIEPFELVKDDISFSKGQKIRIIGHDYTQIEGKDLLIPVSLDGSIDSETDNGRYIVNTRTPSVIVCHNYFH